MYRDLLSAVLLREGVVEVVCKNNVEHYFDRVLVSDDGILDVYSGGISQPLDGFYFDFHIDYAKLLWYIEEDLFLIRHRGKSIHQMEYRFSR